MKKGAESLLLVSMLVIAGFIGFITLESRFVCAVTINVGSGPGNDTTSIQDAIDNFAGDGDTVFVWGGIYYENVIVNKTITLMGESKDTVTIHGDSSLDVVTVERDLVNVTGFTITNGTNGIFVKIVNNVLIQDNIVSLNVQYGIYVLSSNYVEILDNNVTSNIENGIQLMSSTHCNIENNNVVNNYDGIYFDSSVNNNITNNFVFLNQDDGINLYIGSNHNNITDNNVSSTWDDGIFLYTASNNTIAYNEVWNNSDGIFIYLSSHDNVVIDNDAVSNRENGIYAQNSNRCNITDNRIYNNNADGIQIRSSVECNASHNIVTGNEDGIFIRQAWNNNITDNEIYSNRGDGVYLMWGSLFNTIGGNNITHNVYGINTNGADATMIFDNNISYNTDYGIYIGSSAGLIVTGNTMIEDGIFIFSNSFSDWNSHTIDTSNTANGKPVYYFKDQTGGVVPAGAGQVLLVNCTGMVMFDTVLNNCSVGLELGYSHDNLIFHNSEANNIYGFYTYLSNGNSIYNNTVDNNRIRGIYVGLGSGNEIYENNVTGNYLGIFLRDAQDNNVTDNNATGNVEGIYLESSEWNNITGNILLNNADYGINLWDSYNNTLWENDIIGNGNGIYLFASEGNMIYHNSIIDNINQSTDDSAGLNYWDNGYPSGGNYWSDWSPITPDLYSGAATPQVTGSPDGICDTQYDIDGDSIDYYPLREPWDPAGSPPTPPLLLNASDGVTYVYLSWDPPADNGGLPVYAYRIYRGLAENMETFLEEVDNILFYNDTAVTGGSTYYYKVSAVNILGESPQSNEVNGTPLAPPDPPSGLGLASGNVFVNLSWIAPVSDGGSPVLGYNIYRNGTSGIFDFIPAGKLWYNDTNVSNGLTYTYNITAVNSIGESQKSSDESATPLTIPTEPLNLQTVAGDSYVNVSWDVPAYDGGSTITGYTIYRNGTPGIYGTTTGETWFYDAGAVNGFTFTYNITAVNTVGEGPAATISATPMTVPSVPENLLLDTGDEVIYLSWDAPTDDGGSPVTHYNIYRSDIVGVYATVSAGQLSFDDMDVDNGVTYIYIISANNSVGEGPKTLDVNGVPMGTPSAPRYLQADAGDGYVNLTWDVPSDNGGSAITGYNIYRNGTPGVYDTVPAGQLWFFDDDVANGVKYTYYVKAFNIVGEGSDASDSATPMTVPSAPRNPQAVENNGFITISWSPPVDDGGSEITGYMIYRDGTVTIFHTVSASVLSYQDNNVVDGVTYTYYISAANDMGEGALSTGADATAGSEPAAPINLNATTGDSYAFVTWDIPASNGGRQITNYTVYRGISAGTLTFLVILGDILSYNDTSVSNDVTYYYKVSATNEIAEGAQSNPVTATPRAPQIPVNEIPISSITSPSEGDSIEGILTITGTASDPDGSVQRVEISIDGLTWITVDGTDPWTYTLDTTQLTDGVHTITVRSYDGENYSAENSISVTVSNPKGDGDEEPESPILWLLVIIMVIIVILFLFLAGRRKKPEEEEEGIAKPEEPEEDGEDLDDEAPLEEVPPPPPWAEDIEEGGDNAEPSAPEDMAQGEEPKEEMSAEDQDGESQMEPKPPDAGEKPENEPADEPGDGEGEKDQETSG